MGLRSARRRAQEQCEAFVVARDGPGAGGHRRPRRRDPDASPSVGSLWPRRELHGSAGRVPQLPQAFPPGRPAEGRRARDRVAREEARSLWRVLPELQREEARGPEAVQPHVQDLRGTGRGHRVDRVAPARDGAVDLRRLRERPADFTQEAPVRDSADRQGFPQRDHAGQLHLPLARV